jgi:septal ring factor EnvC (AmiA/AmiB activator)
MSRVGMALAVLLLSAPPAARAATVRVSRSPAPPVAPAAAAASLDDLEQSIESLEAKDAAQRAKLDSFEAQIDFHEDQHAVTDVGVAAIDGKIDDMIRDATDRANALAGLEAAARDAAALDLESALLACGERCEQASLRMPAAQGGRLEAVLDVVDADIALAVAGGLRRDTARASELMTAARAALAGGDPRSAFDGACAAFGVLSCAGPGQRR